VELGHNYRVITNTPKTLIVNAQLVHELLPLTFLDPETMQPIEPHSLGLSDEAIQQAQSWHRTFSETEFANVDEAQEAAYDYWQEFRRNLAGRPALQLLLRSGMGEVRLP